MNKNEFFLGICIPDYTIHEKDTFDICFNDRCGIHEKGYGKIFQIEHEEERERMY